MHFYNTPPPPLILLGPAWPACEWLMPTDAPTRHTRLAFAHEVVIADIDADAKLAACDQYCDRWGDRELCRALRIAAYLAGGLDRTMGELLRRLSRRQVVAA